MTETLEQVLGPAGQLLLLPQPLHWTNATGCVLLVLLRLAGQPCPHNPTKREHTGPEDTHPGDTITREANDAV
ncbi:hypothetical protein ACWCPJ_37255 [Streptomyces collinus]